MAIKVKALVWALRGRDATKTEIFAAVPLLEHSVGDAGFTIRKDDIDGSFGLIWWHGNRGHHLGCFADISDAKNAAQRYFENLVFSWIES